MYVHESRFSGQWPDEHDDLLEVESSLSDEELIAAADHVVVPVSAENVHRRMRGITQLLDDAGVEVDSVAGIRGSDCGWIVVEPSTGESAVDVVNLLGSIFAEVSGRNIVAFLGADPVCQSIELAVEGSMELELDPARTIVLASADDTVHDN
jgi:hypothetical protein